MSIQKTIWVLNQLPGFGIQKFKRFSEQYGDLTKLSDREILARLQSSFEEGGEFAVCFQEILSSGEFEREMDQCSQKGIRILSILDSDYPKNLASIYDPPLVLYVKGAFIQEDEVAVAIVGSRYPSVYGVRTAGRFASELAERGLTIVSGFARGIDGEAHRGALRAKGRTIAVLGCGLDIVYPKEHASLREEIVSNGALISEFPLATPPQAFNFPKRNRIISGLSRGVLVVEAGLRSGSLITARVALEEGREVYAVPGPIDSLTSGGTNQLIRDGAKLVISAEDIVEDLVPQIRACVNLWQGHVPVIARSEAPKQSDTSCQIASAISGTGPQKGPVPEFTARNDDDSQDPIVKLLGDTPLSFDELVIGLNEDPCHIRSRMTRLELAGAVKRVFGGRYVRS